MYKEIIKFWFEEISQPSGGKKMFSFDQLIASRFSEVHGQASRCELNQWRDTAEGRLAEIIVLDQFSRNIYRETHRCHLRRIHWPWRWPKKLFASGADKAVL